MKTIHASIAARSAHPRRRGVALLLFALLVFVMLGVAALVADVGSASLAQAQMQSATDSAALEGVRLRDFHSLRPFSDRYRRQRVSELVQHSMDDDLHPTGGVDVTSGGSTMPDPNGLPALGPDGADALRTGAGPLYHVTGGIGDANASAQVSVPRGDEVQGADRYVDDPVLQPNRFNELYGDMLSGTAHVGIHTREPRDYDRIDFTRAANFGAAESWTSIGFLVRMRRSTRPNPLDHVPGVSSRGPGIPLLFGMGSTVHRTDFFNPRTEGLTTRSTSIAVGRPAIHVGPPPMALDGSPIPDRLGAPMRGSGWWHVTTSGSTVVRRHAAIAVDADFWIDAMERMQDTVTGLYVEPDGRLLVEQFPGHIREAGRLMLAQCVHGEDSTSCAGTVGTSIGEPADIDLSQPPYSLSHGELRAIIDAMPTMTGEAGPEARQYLPVYRCVNVDGTNKRVIAFAYGTLTPTGEGRVDITKGWVDLGSGQESPCVVAPDNASATLARSAPQLSTDDWQRIFDANLAFVYPLGNTSYRWQNVQLGALLAPALVR